MKDLDHAADARHWQGVSYKIILSSAETDGMMCIVDSTSPPGSGPPRHRHEAEDETFVVLSGEMLVWIAGETRRLGPGEAAQIPCGVEHTFQPVGDAPARHLVILTPGGFERFFEEMCDSNPRIPEDLPRIVEAAERHNCYFTGPPLES